MNYPDNFETPAFPAGARIAVSRVAAIWVSVVFLLVLFVCGVLVWSTRSQRVHPFLVAVNETPNEWRIVGHDHGKRTLTYVRALQESVVGKFTELRFHISGDERTNDMMWTPCDVATDCATSGTGRCRLFCAGGEDVFSKFHDYVLPDYRARADAGERWSVDMETIRISPVGQIQENGGVWRVRVTIISNLTAPINVIAYARVARDIKKYPRTLGYYVMDFNAYRMD